MGIEKNIDLEDRRFIMTQKLLLYCINVIASIEKKLRLQKTSNLAYDVNSIE